MHITTRLLAGSLFLGAAATNAQAEGDAAEGQALAREICARCHNVEPQGVFKQHPPSFAAIAVYRSEDQIHGRIVFPPLHSGMPQVGHFLTPDSVENLIAYITSLEKQ